MAIEEWRKLRDENEPSRPLVTGAQLERALGAFDMFVLHDQPGDLDDASILLSSQPRCSNKKTDSISFRLPVC